MTSIFQDPAGTHPPAASPEKPPDEGPTVGDHVKRTGRLALAVVSALFAILFGWVTFTVPISASAGPAIITVALAAAAFLVYPRKRSS